LNGSEMRRMCMLAHVSKACVPSDGFRRAAVMDFRKFAGLQVRKFSGSESAIEAAT
jgi:hypothetical protein